MLAGLYRTFNLYVKLPDEDLPKIKIAEKDDEGRAMLKELRRKSLGKKILIQHLLQFKEFLKILFKSFLIKGYNLVNEE